MKVLSPLTRRTLPVLAAALVFSLAATAVIAQVLISPCPARASYNLCDAAFLGPGWRSWVWSNELGWLAGGPAQSNGGMDQRLDPYMTKENEC
jgi:hypothetical protein